MKTITELFTALLVLLFVILPYAIPLLIIAALIKFIAS